MYIKIFCSVRVRNEIGGGNPKAAAFSVVVATMVSTFIAIVEVVIVYVFRHVVSYAFTEGETVANTVAHLCPHWYSPCLSWAFNLSFLIRN